MQYQVLTFILLIFVFGCETSTKPKPTNKTAKTASQTEKTNSDPVSLPPKYKPVIVSMNNHKSGSGSTSTFTPQQNSPNVNVKYGMTSGQDGAVSKLNWEYLSTDEKGDHYRFERSFPHDQPNQVVTTKEVIYQGKEIIIFEDDTQRISMFPLQVDKEPNSK
ncbi:hypothetical protein [Gimesia aquarii]|uniref:Uncharacterized protein n=1 Tax=Gimesia aquarii TaxID=2527964 RepID=A0A517WUL6_9PLAN|nr:hypothetical protein [Gimesia aquarii]QDU08949.1 hypothetical protein V202x_23190 [Gimesia aquarii]